MNAAVDVRAIHGSQDEFVNEGDRAAGCEKSKRYGLFIAGWKPDSFPHSVALVRETSFWGWWYPER
jgi:hypothetical protein